MNKYRTQKQDYNLIKGIIDSKTKLDIPKILKDENLTIWAFFSCYRKFVLTTYLCKTSTKEIRLRVANELVKKGLYKAQSDARSSKYALVDKGLNLASKSFKKQTYKMAIGQMSQLKNEMNHVDSLAIIFCANNDTYSDGFFALCDKYNLTPAVERNRKRKFYTITTPAITEEEKRTKELLDEQKKEIKAQEERQKSILLLREKKEKIKFLEKLSKTHYKGRNYTQENIIKLDKMDCLKLNGYNQFDNQKVLNKIQELQNSIQ